MSIVDDLKKQPPEGKKWTDTIKPKNNGGHVIDGSETAATDVGSTNVETSNEVDIVTKLTQENASLKDKLLRTLAELENTRRICEEEKSKTIKFAITNIAKDLIVVMDNFYRAFDNLKDKNTSLETFSQGIELNFNELKKIFDKNGIKRIFPLDEMFNPTFHEAISQIESDKEAGTVVEVLQAGYILNDRVIKPALVVVAK